MLPVISRLCLILTPARPFLATLSRFLVSRAMCSLTLECYTPDKTSMYSILLRNSDPVLSLFPVCSRLFCLFSATLEDSTSHRAVYVFSARHSFIHTPFYILLSLFRSSSPARPSCTTPSSNQIIEDLLYVVLQG
jgi:hypothetical protein